MPGDPRGAAMMQAFQQLMSDPTAQKAMMQGAQQMGIPPQMLAQFAGGGGGGGQQMPMTPMEGGGQSMPPEAMVEGAEGAPPMDPEQMAQGQVDSAGYMWDGVDAPTQNDIQRLTEDPSPEAIASFNEQFGDGAAEQYLGGGSEDTEEGTEAPSGNASEADEY